MAESGTDQHQSRIAIREAAHYSGAAADLPVEPFHDIVGADSQYQNRQKILLNKKRTEEHRARTHRLIGRGAILEAVFPAVVEMEGAEVEAFLIALSRLPGAAELAVKAQNARDEG